MLMSTDPVLKVLLPTEAVSVNSASTLRLSSATNAARTAIVAVSFLTITARSFRHTRCG